MWMLPLYLHVNQKSDYDDMIFDKHPIVTYILQSSEIPFNLQKYFLY